MFSYRIVASVAATLLEEFRVDDWYESGCFYKGFRRLQGPKKGACEQMGCIEVRCYLCKGTGLLFPEICQGGIGDPLRFGIGIVGRLSVPNEIEFRFQSIRRLHLMKVPFAYVVIATRFGDNAEGKQVLTHARSICHIPWLFSVHQAT